MNEMQTRIYVMMSVYYDYYSTQTFFRCLELLNYIKTT